MERLRNLFTQYGCLGSKIVDDLYVLAFVKSNQINHFTEGIQTEYYLNKEK